MIDKKVLQMHFSRNAESYDTYAKVQKKMANQLIEMIENDFNNSFDYASSNEMKEAKLRGAKCKGDFYLDILDIGCGTGYLTKQLLSNFSNVRITAIDIAPGMIEYAIRKFKGSNIEFLCCDIEDTVMDKKFDLIISNAAFQWFNNFEETIENIGQLLNNNGVLAFSTFGNLTFNELNCSFEIACKKLKINEQHFPGQRLFTVEEMLEICKDKLNGTHSNLYEFAISESFEYEYFNSVREFLYSVKKVGANNSNKSRKVNTLLTREMIRAYEEKYKTDDLIQATYHCIFIAAKKIESARADWRAGDVIV